MKIGNWNFDRLPELEHKRTLQAIEQEDEAMLIKIHNKYKLSPYDYGCCPNGILTYFTEWREKKDSYA